MPLFYFYSTSFVRAEILIKIIYILVQTITRQKDILKLTDIYETNRHSESISFQPKYQLSPDRLEFGKHVQQKQDYCLKRR